MERVRVPPYRVAVGGGQPGRTRGDVLSAQQRKAGQDAEWVGLDRGVRRDAGGVERDGPAGVVEQRGEGGSHDQAPKPPAIDIA